MNCTIKFILTILQLANLCILLFKLLTYLLCRHVVTQWLCDFLHHSSCCIFSASDIVTLINVIQSTLVTMFIYTTVKSYDHVILFPVFWLAVFYTAWHKPFYIQLYDWIYENGVNYRCIHLHPVSHTPKKNHMKLWWKKKRKEKQVEEHKKIKYESVGKKAIPLKLYIATFGEKP